MTFKILLYQNNSFLDGLNKRHGSNLLLLLPIFPKKNGNFESYEESL